MMRGLNSGAGKSGPPGAALLIFVFFFCLYSLTIQGLPTGGDAWGMFLATRSLVDDGDAFLAHESNVVLVPGINNNPVSKFGVGQSIAETPAYMLASYLSKYNKSVHADTFLFFVTAFTSPLLGAAICVLIFLTCLRLGYGSRVSLTVTIVAGLCTLLWPHTKWLFSEPLQALALIGAFHSLLLVGQGEGGLPGAPSAGFFLGLLAATKLALAVVIVPAGVYLLVCLAAKKSRRPAVDLISFVLMLGFWAAVILGYNYIRFGDIFETGYMVLRDRETLYGFSMPLLTGVHGLLLSSGKGLFFYAPVLIAAVAALPGFVKRYPGEGWLIIFISLPVVAVFAMWNQWHGDYSWGPRFLVPLIPLLVLPLGNLLAPPPGESLNKVVVAAVAALAAVSIFVQALGVVVNYNEYLLIMKTQVPYDMYYDSGNPGRIDKRDDLLNPHYVPEFSPLAGHWWLLKHIVKDRRLEPGALRKKMQSDFPWKGLMPYAVPQLDRPRRAVVLDFWWYYLPKFYPRSAGWVARSAYTLLVFFSLSALGLLFVFFRFRAAYSEVENRSSTD